VGLFGKKKNKYVADDGRNLTVEEALLKLGDGKKSGDKEPGDVLDDIWEGLKNSERIRNESGHEFEEIEKHLSDIQRFESLPKEIRQKITELAESIRSYEQQRLDYQKGSKVISEDRYRIMDMYSSEMPEKLKEMEERERYLMLVQNDLRQLEGEKGSILYEKSETEKKKKFLIRFTQLTVVALIALSIFLLVLSSYTGKSMLLPFLIMGALACVYAAYFVVAMKNADETRAKDEKLMGRAVDLLNKVRIKYVNTVNILDYMYEKYKCNSHQELRYIWQGYQKEKEEERKFRKNSDLLSIGRDGMKEILEASGFALPGMWIYQPEMFIDKAERENLKEVLLNRHRKLKAQLDFNSKQKAGMMAELKAFSKKHPEYSGILDLE